MIAEAGPRTLPLFFTSGKVRVTHGSLWPVLPPREQDRGSRADAGSGATLGCAEALAGRVAPCLAAAASTMGCVIETKQSEKRKDGKMSRFEDTEAALTERLRAMKAKPDMTVNLFDIGVPLNDDGYSQDEIMEVLFALEQDKVIAFTPGNRILMLKALPG